MRTRVIGPGEAKFIIEEGDPVVLTDLAGVVVAGPHPAPPAGEMIIDYDGPRVDEVCWGVLSPTGILAFQSKPFGVLHKYDRVNLELDRSDDEHLTSEDRSWLKRVTGFMP